MSKFKIPPISTLIGTTIFNFLRVISNNKISPRYYLNVFISFLIVLLASPFHIIEWVYFSFKLKNYILKKDPIFILGHWRSGTTLLHNVLSKDKNLGYFTTYNSLFSNNLTTKFLFKTLMKITMPKKRPADNVKLGIDLPQEDEFALGNYHNNSYYYFFYFPSNYQFFYNKAIRFDVSDDDKKDWRNKYDELIKKANINTNGSQIIVKNPCNTARINQLLKMYPNAKFIHIYRNPVTVYLSTIKFFTELFPSVQLQNTSQKVIQELVIEVYKRLHEDYFSQVHNIPKNQLYELKFEDFEKKPISYLKDIYQKLDIDDFDKSESLFREYFNVNKKYKKNTYSIQKNDLDLIIKEWRFVFKKYKYLNPKNVNII